MKEKLVELVFDSLNNDNIFNTNFKNYLEKNPDIKEQFKSSGEIVSEGEKKTILQSLRNYDGWIRYLEVLHDVPEPKDDQN